MTEIRILEPELLTRRGFNGFYRHFLSALMRHGHARLTDAVRPLPRLTVPREHESCWVQWNGEWVFFDMSDHVQLLDLEALKLCRVYFKANLHRGIANRILAANGLENQQEKLAPFLFFAEGLPEFIREGKRRRFWRLDCPRRDVCFVMGVYENPVRDGLPSPFEHPDVPLTPASMHFWIRWHVMESMKEAGIPGWYRLTSRAVRKLEDHRTVYPNVSRRTFSRWISRSRITGVCTLPHALFPWKASESFALGRPILIERAPITETPEPFRLQQGLHYLELFPELPGPAEQADLTDPESYRILQRIPPVQFRERAEELRLRLQDRDRLAEMGEACRQFAEKAYDLQTVFDYIFTEVNKRIR